MSEYIVSARKYRPDSFQSLIGQDNIAQTLKNSIIRGQLAHAYLFCGPRGVGKTSTARIFAKAINCSLPTPDMDPCGECESCKSFAEGRSYCIYELDAASNSGVDAMRDLIEKVQIPPQTGKYSVYIIDEVHMLSQQAFNAFLKTLEEPPAYAIFILATTEKHKVLPTILSRCQTYDFNRIGIMDMVANLRGIAQKEGITVDDGSLHVIAQKADGAMRDALTIFDQTVAFCGTTIQYQDVINNLNVLDYEYCFKLVDSFLAGDHATALLIFDEILAKGFNAQYFVSALSSHIRDLIVSKTGGLDTLLDYPEALKERYAGQAAACSFKFLYDALTLTNQCEVGYKTAVNPRLHIEFTLMKLAFMKGLPESVPASPVRTARAGLSLSSLLSKNPDSPAEAPVTPVQDAPLPSDDAVLDAWEQLYASYSTTQPRLSVAMKQAITSIEAADDRKVLTFQVENVSQKAWIEEKKLREMEEKIQGILSSRKIRLEVDVKLDTEVKEEKYMPAEKAQDLMDRHEEFKNIVIDLSLDI